MNDRSSVQSYISQCHAQGMKSEKIILSLISSGWSEDDARNAILGTVSNQSRSKKWWIIIVIGIIVVVVAGIVYWFVFRQGDDANNNTQTTNTNTSSAVTDNSNVSQVKTATEKTDVIAQVFGETILRGDVEEMALMFLDVDYLSYTGIIGKYGSADRSNEMVALLGYMDSLVIKETISRLGVTPKTDEEIAEYIESVLTQEYWDVLLDQTGLGEEHKEILTKYQIADIRERELYSLVDDTFQSSYNDLLGQYVTEIYNAFKKKLTYLSDEDKKSLSSYSSMYSSRRESDLFPSTDPNFLNNDSDTLIQELDIPLTLKNEIIGLQQTPYTLTSLIEEDGYYYFGMVHAPEEKDFPEGFDKSEVLIVRFPWVDGFYDSLLISLTWEDGLKNNEIEIYGAPGLELQSADSYLDTDGDGLYNYVEWVFDSDSNEVDTDKDGKTDLEEYEAGTNPNEAN